MDGQMQSRQLQQQDSRHINPRIIKYGLIYFFIIFIITSTLIGFGAYNILAYPNVYAGVYINDVYVGGETRESIAAKLIEKYQSALESKTITITSKGKIKQFSCKEIDAAYDIDEAISQAFNVGRVGNPIKRLFTISSIKKNNVIIPLEIQADMEKIKSKIKELADQVDIPVKEYEAKVEKDRLKIINGTHGEKINLSQAADTVLETIMSGDSDSIQLIAEIIKPKDIDVDELYRQICVEPANAYYQVKDYRINIVPHITGRRFNKEEAKKIIDSHQSEGEEFFIPLTVVQPEIVKEELELKLFRDRLSQYTTSFNVNYVERSHNILLAANEINGIVLGPGDVFSYNEVVGERTPELGYQNAKVYVGGKIIDGIGGGICQVSSTLYNAVLFSDLEVINRVNHSMTVAYVPIGQDAAVAYGLLDFKFRNNTAWPIKLVSKLKGGQVTFEIWGTNEVIGKSVSIENIIVQTIPFTVKYVDDPNLEEGKTVIQQKGSNGFVVDTYKIIKQDGKVISKKLISRSTYRPLEQIEARGTKKVVQATEPKTNDQNNQKPEQNQQPKTPEQSQQPQGSPEKPQVQEITEPAAPNAI